MSGRSVSQHLGLVGTRQRMISLATARDQLERLNRGSWIQLIVIVKLTIWLHFRQDLIDAYRIKSDQ